MATAADVIREFLVSLRWQTDVNSENRMKDSITTMTRNVIEIGRAIENTAKVWIGAIEQMAEKAENLYWASGRLGSSVQNINQFTYAIGQMGGSGAAARQSLEALANFFRSSPGAGGVLVGLGIDPHAMKDTVELTTQLSKRFAEFSRQGQYYRAKAYASFMGIDELTLQAMIRDAGKFGTEYLNMVKAVGLNQQEASENATYFMQRLRALGAAIDIVWEKAASGIYHGVGDQLENLRNLIISHSDQIVSGIEVATKIVLTLAQVLGRWIGRAVEIVEELYRAYSNLSPHMQAVIKDIIMFTAAWRILSAVFSMSPIGRVIALGTAIVGLIDDYMTWKEKGQSLIDWEKWEPYIQAAVNGIQQIIDVIDNLTKNVPPWQIALEAFAAYIAGRWLLSVSGSLLKLPVMMAEAIIGSLAKVEASEGAMLALAGRFGVGFAARFAGPIALAIYEMWPKSVATDAEEKATPGYEGRFKPPGQPPGAPINPAQFSGVPDELVGSMANQKLPDIGGNFMSRIPLKMGSAVAFGSPVMKQVVGFLQSKGWSAAQAAGIAANMWQESSLNPSAEGDSGLAYGIGQWHPDRQAAFQRLFGKDIRNSTMPEQLAFYDWELHHTEAKAGNLLSAAKDPYSAAIAVEQAERPKAMNIAHPGTEEAARGGYAQRIFDATAGAAPLAGGDAGAGGVGEGDKNVTMNQTNNVTVQGQDGVRAVIGALGRQNADLLRNVQGAVR